MKRETELISFNPCPDDPFHANSTPIYQTATFALESALGGGKYDYSRSGNPTRDIVSEQIAKLEGAKYGLGSTSGMASLNVLLGLVKSGEHIIAGDDIYGGTFRLITKRLLTHKGITVTFIDITDLEKVKQAFKPNTRLILVETPSNPLQKIANLAQIAELSKKHQTIFAVDNSFMSPWLQQPLNFGADVVINSATKHLSGHSDVSGGFLLVNNDELAKELSFIQNAEGCALAPFDSWLILRGLKTLGLRIERQTQNSEIIVDYLQKHKLVTKLYYPTLSSHPGSNLHKQQASGGGNIICFETNNIDLSTQIVNKTELFNISVSFGGVHSSISLPVNMSHAAILKTEHQIASDLVRISVGIEDSGDLIADLEQAFNTKYYT